eukprot:scaffold192764_cov42-Prasinocladus_malaysianus.AAC.2
MFGSCTHDFGKGVPSCCPKSRVSVSGSSWKCQSSCPEATSMVVNPSPEPEAVMTATLSSLEKAKYHGESGPLGNGLRGHSAVSSAVVPGCHVNEPRRSTAAKYATVPS